MQIFKHLTANDIHLDAFPFRRELSMEAYLIENESVLGLDNDTFSNVEIIEAELTLAQGRSSKDTDGRIDILATYSQEYIAVIELKLGELKEIHLKQLEDYLKEKEQILTQYPDILDASISPTPKWIGVLVGNTIDPNLASKIHNGYIFNDIQVATLTIQRFRGSDGSIFVTTDTYFKNIPNKDNSTYEFGGKLFGKGRLVLEVLKHYCAQNPDISFAQLEKDFPKNCQGSVGVFASHDEAFEIYSNSGRKRHFLKENELIKLKNSTISICNQWGIENIKHFIKQAEKLGIEISSPQKKYG